MAPKRRSQATAADGVGSKKKKVLTTEEFLEHSRGATLKALQTKAQHLDEEDLDHLMASIRALVDMNKQIWERCELQKQDHLKSVQVMLGEVDSWLVEPSHAYAFIEEKFDGVNILSIPTKLDSSGGNCGATHTRDVLCTKCLCPLSEHSHLSTIPNSYPYRSKQCNYFCKLLRHRATFHHPKTVLLKEIPMPNGAITKRFPVSSQTDQERLTKFLEFLSV
mmetsp:Transcript_4988/g.6498  ORF Transcript_4988/g.6498 Transcript_4988/m.6498 type:complete len:221 (+) Transcript_4988:135-797(+)